jgi:protein-S-isoprenylcysteine O-methyltransferase Ste14
VTIAQKVRAALLAVSGYVIPLVQQIPPLGVYAGLMTLPVILYLVALFSQLPLSFIDAFRAFLEGTVRSPGALLTNAMIVVGFVLVLYSAIYLQWHRKQGLVTTGPYRFIRHPQYTGFLLFTLGLTAWSYWLLSVTFGIGWLTREGTIVLWYAELCAYIVLALIEDSYLSKQFGDGYAAYKRKVPSFLPLGRASRLDILLSITILSLILFGTIQLQFFAPII